MIVQTACTVFKFNLISGAEDFNSPSPYVYKIALYDANADLNNTTTAYTTTNEVTGSGYTAGGVNLTPVVGSDTANNVAYITFSNVTWSPASFTCRGALIYNSTTGAAVAVLNFGSDKTATTTFTIQFPSATSTSAILRIN
tara:strand:- start:617 stop:1039 length:423 start_codon:yes stop_codon:yes gene_type:complete